MTIYSPSIEPAPAPDHNAISARKAALPLEHIRTFANREQETTKINSLLHDLQDDGNAHHCIVNFFGVPGIGKTELLLNVKKRFLGTRFSGIYCNLEQVGSTDLHNAKDIFLRHLHQNIRYAASAGASHNAPAALVNVSDEHALDTSLDRLAEYLLSLNQVILLVVDSWEHVQETLFAWFEWRLLLPLIARGRVVGVFGSQAPLRWRQFDVRRRVDLYQLEPLDTEATSDQLDVSAELASAVYQITYGHPLANEIVRALLDAVHAPAAYLASQGSAIAAQVVGGLLARAKVEPDSELRSILQAAALLREFDVNTLRVVLPSAFPVFTNRSQSALMLAIRQLAETRMIRWDDRRRAYQLDSTLRAIFTHELRLNHPGWYTELRHATIEFYTSLIAEVPSRREEYLLEWLYQTMQKPDWDERDASPVQNQFREYIKRYYSPPRREAGAGPAVARLRTLLAQDQELHVALGMRGFSPESFLGSAV